MPVDDVLWCFEEHTKAKHKILKRYIEAWAPILGSYLNERIVYIDGFAGPGESIDHDPGSPLIALDSIIHHRIKINSEIIFLFIEKDRRRSEYLENLIKRKYSNLPTNIKYEVRNGDFNEILSKILDSLEKENKGLAPTFCFVDPFGYKDINIDLLARFMNQEKAELLITFMAGFITRFLKEQDPFNSLNEILTSDEISRAKNLQKDEREEFILHKFLEKLKSKITKKIYDISFEVKGINNNLLYYLIYLTSNLKGLEAMKEAMYAVSQNKSEFKFSDFDFEPYQTTLIDYGLEQEWCEKAADELYQYIVNNGYIGQELTWEEIKNIIIEHTKYVDRKCILKSLEDKGKIQVTNRKRNKTYPDNAKIKFI